MTLGRLLSRRVGEGAGRPGLARCCCRVTVSTRQIAPRSRFPRALRVVALSSDLTGSPPPTLLPSARGGHDFRQRPAQEARGEQAQAIHRPPQGPPEYPSPGLHRSTTARRHRGAGSDALPTDGMGRSLAWGSARMVCDAVIFEKCTESAGCRCGICWQSADCEQSIILQTAIFIPAKAGTQRHRRRTVPAGWGKQGRSRQVRALARRRVPGLATLARNDDNRGARGGWFDDVPGDHGGPHLEIPAHLS